MLIAVDFDGTIVENKYPGIGQEMLFAFATIKALQKERHEVILWTFRSGRELDEAVEFCKKNGVDFYAVNCSYPGEVLDSKTSRKINADIFIDDRNVGGFIGWGRVWQLLNPGKGKQDFVNMVLDADAHYNYKKYNKGFINKVLDSMFGKKLF